MNSADLLNLKVKHKAYGIGVITEVSGVYLTVKFATKESKFIYPDSFEKFIVADDASVQAEIMKEINNIKLVAEMQRQAVETARKADEERRAAERQAAPITRNKRNIEDGFVYHDHWSPDGDFLYSGEGRTGDQQMTLGNRAIVDAERDGKIIHLFVKFSPQEYYYQGVFFLVDYTYEDEKDESGNERKEYKFRLRKMSTEE